MNKETKCYEEIEKVFESALRKASIEPIDIYLHEFRGEFEKRKYDIQDITFIQFILKNDRSELEKIFVENSEKEACYKDETEKIKGTVRLFLQSLEHFINYYYNIVVTKHFSSI